jgi:CRISPR-associated protein Cas1
MIVSEDLIPLRMLNEYLYCRRLFWYEYVDNIFIDSEDTIHGRFLHRNVDKKDEINESSKNLHATSVTMSSEKYGITGKFDLITSEDGLYIPNEYKSGNEQKNGLPWENDTYQTVAQAMLLLDNGYKCTYGYVYYFKTKKRIKITISGEAIARTVSIINEMKQLVEAGKIPDPLEDSPKCIGCSLSGICLPDETYLYSGKNLEEIRRLYPARDDKYPVYVKEQGSYISKKNNRLIITTRDGTKTEVNLIEISNLSLFGNIQISTQLVHELLQREIPVLYYSLSGWYYGITQGNYNKNSALRLNQYRTAADDVKSLLIARNIVSYKIKNSRTIIRRNLENKKSISLDILKESLQDALQAKTEIELLGIEGNAARVYFSEFYKLLKGNIGFDIESRNRRPPRDPVNSLLSYLYSILLKDIVVSIISVGMDPYIGFYHKMKYGKPSLALDLMEEYRPIVVDSLVLSLVNKNIVDTGDFEVTKYGVFIKNNAKNKILNAYENRMDTLIQHPVFGYTISYRRTMEVQARLLARHINGEIQQYTPMYTR